MKKVNSVTNDWISLPYQTTTCDTAPPTPRHLSCCLRGLLCGGWVEVLGRARSSLHCWLMRVMVRLRGSTLLTLTFEALGDRTRKTQHSMSFSCLLNILNLLCSTTTPRPSVTLGLIDMHNNKLPLNIPYISIMRIVVNVYWTFVRVLLSYTLILHYVHLHGSIWQWPRR